MDLVSLAFSAERFFAASMAAFFSSRAACIEMTSKLIPDTPHPSCASRFAPDHAVHAHLLLGGEVSEQVHVVVAILHDVLARVILIIGSCSGRGGCGCRGRGRGRAARDRHAAAGAREAAEG